MKKTVTYNYKRATKRLLLYITRAMDKGLTLQKISDGIRSIVNSYIGLNRDERYLLYKTIYDLARKCRSSKDWKSVLCMRKSFDAVLTASRKVDAHANLRHKRIALKLAQVDSQIIFFLCSSHIKPAEDHKDYQGKIYVDRYWRMKVSGSDYKAVASYIKNHQVVTVQDIMGPPVYMTTRPYCKHYFIPMRTQDVLHSSVRKLVELNGYDRDKQWSSEEYFDVRSKVYDAMNKVAPCEMFRKKIKHG